MEKKKEQIKQESKYGKMLTINWVYGKMLTMLMGIWGCYTMFSF